IDCGPLVLLAPLTHRSHPSSSTTPPPPTPEWMAAYHARTAVGMALVGPVLIIQSEREHAAGRERKRSTRARTAARPVLLGARLGPGLRMVPAQLAGGGAAGGASPASPSDGASLETSGSGAFSGFLCGGHHATRSVTAKKQKSAAWAV